MEELFGTKKLGFGCMRLPLTGPTSQVDFEKTCRMVDDFLAAGFCLSLIQISEPTRRNLVSRMPSSA